MKAVIMAGGRGARFWPASRISRPKQFLNILGQRTMLQETMARLDSLLTSSDLYVVCNQEYVEDVRTQAPGLSARQIIVEPAPRNTAACVGLAATMLADQFPEEVMVALPADHLIQDVNRFHRLLKAAERLAQDDHLVTFGVRPRFAATGYGYLERGEPLGEFGGEQAFEVVRFIEKPDREMAEKLVRQDRFDWNSGIFAWKISTILRTIEQHMPELHECLQQIGSSADQHSEAQEAYTRLPSVSIDVGVMEKAERVAVIPADLGWNDVGSWRVLADILSADEAGNVANSFLVPLDSRRCIVRSSSGKLVALIGVEDLVVVETPDALLVCPRERSEEVRRLVDELSARGLEEFL